MNSDYTVNVGIPINPALEDASTGFKFGASFGYNPKINPDDAYWYWDGIDIWLAPSNNSVLANFKGTLKFYASGTAIHEWVSDESDPYDEPLHAIGDSIVLQLWPQDYIQLKQIFPQGLPIPKYIVYQNVIRTETINKVVNLILTQPEQYKRIFMNEDEDELQDGEFATRVNTWISEDWINSIGVGVLIDVGDDIGTVDTTSTISTVAFEGIKAIHEFPLDVDGTSWSRLTLKVADEKFHYFNISYLDYLLQNINNDYLRKNWDNENAFILSSIEDVNSKIKGRVIIQIQTDEDFISNPILIPAFPEISVVLYNNEEFIRRVSAIYDPFMEPQMGYWKFQSWLPAGSYSTKIFGSEIFAKESTNLELIQNAEAIQLPDGTFLQILTNPPWFEFEIPMPNGLISHEKRFILGVNMESVRRRENHDLGGHDLKYEYQRNTITGLDEPVLQYTTAWMDSDAPAYDKLKTDLQNIKSMGVSSIRVWAFENLEGIRFNITEPGSSAQGSDSILTYLKKQADQKLVIDLHSYWFPSDLTIHMCSKSEFESLSSAWQHGLVVSPPSNLLFQKLLANAKILQQIADDNGLRVLWTLTTHYGEGAYNISWQRLINLSANRTGILPARNPLDPTAWANYYATPIQPGTIEGRLPIEAWIHRSIITRPETMESYINNIVTPFVQAMENSPGRVLGYDLINEPDIMWDRCNHSWANFIAGSPSLPTNWKIDGHWIRKFIKRSEEAVRQAVGPTQNYKLILNSVLGSQDPDTEHEFQIIQQNDLLPVPLQSRGEHPITLNLSASAMTRYANQNNWQEPYSNLSQNPFNVILTSWLRTQSDKCLLMEAGTNPWPSGRGFREREVDQKLTIAKLMGSAISKGYAGVFIWCYGDPERSETSAFADGRDINALTQPFGYTSGTLFNNSSIGERLAVAEIRRFANNPILSQYLLPQLS